MHNYNIGICACCIAIYKENESLSYRNVCSILNITFGYCRRPNNNSVIRCSGSHGAVG
nr:MAG TPA: hypothetical protein [Caudoviricetes sp.]